MKQYTDSQLLLIENLTYLLDPVLISSIPGNKRISGEELVKSVNYLLSSNNPLTIKELLNEVGLGEKAVECLKNVKENGAEIKNFADTFMSSLEIASLLEGLLGLDEKCDKSISELEIVSIQERPDGCAILALCFIENGKKDEAIVAFVGTSGENEWVDDAKGLNTSDTSCQADALSYIDKVNSELGTPKITAIGHSKGGNKAMYVGIRADNVEKVVSFDGQGFSEEFLEAYSPLIEKNAGKITNYSLSNDFVHILMHQIPGTTQKFIKGNGLEGPGEQHASNSFFSMDKNKKIQYDKSGNPTMKEAKNDNDVAVLRDFVAYLMNNSSKEDRKAVEYLLEDILSALFKENGSLEDVLDAILANKDNLVILVAYLLRYMEEMHVSFGSLINAFINLVGAEELDFFTNFYLNNLKVKKKELYHSA